MSGLRSWTGREFHGRGPAAAEVLSRVAWIHCLQLICLIAGAESRRFQAKIERRGGKCDCSAHPQGEERSRFADVLFFNYIFSDFCQTDYLNMCAIDFHDICGIARTLVVDELSEVISSISQGTLSR